MAAVPPAPPPPPVSCGNQAPTPRTTPCPQRAAIPFHSDPPIQETSHSQVTLHDAQGAEAPPNSLVQNAPWLLLSHGQEGTFSSGGAEKCPPVQETNPAPQALGANQIQVQQDEQDSQMNPSGQDHVV